LYSDDTSEFYAVCDQVVVQRAECADSFQRLNRKQSTKLPKLMNADSAIPTRLKASAPGLGQASASEVEQRASELAAMDGRHETTDADLSRAAAELAGNGTTADSLDGDADTDEIIAPDEPAPHTGRLVVAPPLIDEDNLAEQLIEDGLAEADHDIRVAAADQSRDEDA
jgi:hypothetical protein